ncbi:MAG TPA: hypothetical protein V6C72_07235 [Chroococcales cyanobacterium]
MEIKLNSVWAHEHGIHFPNQVVTVSKEVGEQLIKAGHAVQHGAAQVIETTKAAAANVEKAIRKPVKEHKEVE